MQKRLVVRSAFAVWAFLVFDFDQPRLLCQRDHVFVQTRDVIVERSEDDVAGSIGFLQDAGIAGCSFH